MRIFSPLYDLALKWSRHPHAERYLAGVSFAESSFFPIPPDVLLAPMVLARPERWWRLAAITTVTSVLGGLFGYLIGYVAIEAVTPVLHRVGYWQHFETAHDWFERYGFWAIFAAGFTPIPYKVFTIAAGAAHMGLLPFTLGSLVGRGARFLLVAGLVRWGGAPIEHQIRRYIDGIGWATLVALLAGYAIWSLFLR
jgi:membrane protein YqaA with SNARE-associated domain